jgi:hypothetical protein
MAMLSNPVLFTSAETYTLGSYTLPNYLIFDYDTVRWNFRALVSDFFGTDNLEQLHLFPQFNPRNTTNPLPNYEITQNSWAINKILKAAVAPLAEQLFRSLLYEYVATFFFPIFGYQSLAGMCVNFHGSKAVLRFHADAEYGQRLESINLWLPVTKVWGSNSMYLESDVGRADFTPLQLEYGQACIFHGGELVHGTVDNDSGSTRISYDIRFRVKQP